MPELPGVTVYGTIAEEATTKARALALRVIAEEIEHGELRLKRTHCSFRSSRERVAVAGRSASTNNVASNDSTQSRTSLRVLDFEWLRTPAALIEHASAWTGEPALAGQV